MRAKPKIFTPYAKSHDEAYFDLVNQKDNYDLAYNNPPDNTQTGISNSNIHQSTSSKSVFLSQTISEPESNQIRRMSTAQKLINDPKLMQIRIFMNQQRKEKNNNEEEDNGYKRSKSLVMQLTKRSSNRDRSDNDELQMIDENQKDNDIKEITNQFLKTGKIVSVKDDGEKFIVKLDDDDFDTELDELIQHFQKTYF